MNRRGFLGGLIAGAAAWLGVRPATVAARETVPAPTSPPPLLLRTNRSLTQNWYETMAGGSLRFKQSGRVFFARDQDVTLLRAVQALKDYGIASPVRAGWKRVFGCYQLDLCGRELSWEMVDEEGNRRG